MAESLPMPNALRFVVEDEAEWVFFQPYLARGNFPAGMNPWLNQKDPEARRAGDLVGAFEQRLAAALSSTQLSASGFLKGATHESQIDGTRCEELEIRGENGTDVRIRGLDYASVLISKRDPKNSAGKLAEKRKLEGELIRELAPFIAQLKDRCGQTNYKELRAFLKGRGFSNFADSLLEKAAAAAGLTKGMVRLGRPREANSEKE